MFIRISMKILLLPSYFYPEGVASPYIGWNRNQAFVDEGWNLVVYTPVPCRGVSDDVRTEYKSRKFELMLNGKMSVHRFPLVSEKENTVIRAFRYFAQNLKQFNRGIFAKDARSCDVMLIASTPPTQGAMASLIKIFTGRPFVYNLQDVFPDSLVGTGLAKKGGILWKIGRKIEDFTYRYADKIIVISEDFKRNIMAKGVPEDKIEVIYNWVEQDAVVDVPRSENKLFAKYNLDPSKFYVEYSGNVGLTQNMDMLLEVAEEFLRCEEVVQSSKFKVQNVDDSDNLEPKTLNLEPDSIHFVIVGEGAYKAEVEKRVKERNLTNVHLFPFQPYEDISHVFSLGDVGLVISKSGVGANSVPSKTWSIMSASRPVLANFDENELKDILEGTIQSSGLKNPQGPCGIFTKAGDKEAFKAAIIKLYQNRQLGIEYGQNGRQFILDNLTKEVGTKKYVDVIKGVVNG